jgi:hypothetical protein
MNILVILAFFSAAIAHAQQEQQQQPTRQRRAHLSLRQEQQQQGDASPFLTEMMEIETEVSEIFLAVSCIPKGP